MDDKGVQRTEALTVLKSRVKAGELHKATGQGIYFAYDPGWLATGYDPAQRPRQVARSGNSGMHEVYNLASMHCYNYSMNSLIRYLRGFF